MPTLTMKLQWNYAGRDYESELHMSVGDREKYPSTSADLLDHMYQTLRDKMKYINGKNDAALVKAFSDRDEERMIMAFQNRLQSKMIDPDPEGARILEGKFNDLIAEG